MSYLSFSQKKPSFSLITSIGQARKRKLKCSRNFPKAYRHVFVLILIKNQNYISRWFFLQLSSDLASIYASISFPARSTIGNLATFISSLFEKNTERKKEPFVHTSDLIEDSKLHLGIRLTLRLDISITQPFMTRNESLKAHLFVNYYRPWIANHKDNKEED